MLDQNIHTLFSPHISDSIYQNIIQLTKNDQQLLKISFTIIEIDKRF